MYIPKFFELYEFLPKDFYNKWYPISGNRLWQLLDIKLLVTCDRLRRRYGKVEINNWYWKKDGQRYNQWSGLRTPDSPYGTALSQHRFGRAGDLKFYNVTAEEIRDDIKTNPFHEDFIYITGLEERVSWLHIDFRNWEKKKNGLYLFRG